MNPVRLTFFLLLSATTFVPSISTAQLLDRYVRKQAAAAANQSRVEKAVASAASDDSYWRRHGEPTSGHQPKSITNRQEDELDEDQPETDADDTAETNDDDDEETAQSLQGLTDWPRSSIRNIGIDPRDRNGKLPPDRSGSVVGGFTRNWSDFETVQKNYCWQAPNIHYLPLYFEDVALERYGQTPDDYWQTALSAAHFFSSAALLPLHFRDDPVYSCDYPLGYCRPGLCTRKIWQRQFWGRCP